jgi:hypothetical protein
MKQVSLVALALLCVALRGISTAAEPKPASPTKTGEITGVITFCGSQGSGGILVYIAGRSFVTKTGPSGDFVLYFVPAGTYTLTFEVAGQAPFQSSGVIVTDNTVTNLGTLSGCPDSDNDGYDASADCNDNNPNINPGAAEICDGVDNNCNGQVDEGCQQICTDADQDGFFAQAGCGTAVDCNDGNPLIRPNAAEICDGRDNNCNGTTDEGFDTTADPLNCGFCGNVCSFANATAACVSGVCALVSCSPGFNNCDGSPANGCETDTSTDNNNCGTCGAVCTPGTRCANSVCVCDQITCPTGVCVGNQCTAGQ